MLAVAPAVVDAGTGKTTLLRDIARLMSLPPEQGGLGLAVIIVDTSNEIAGDRVLLLHCALVLHMVCIS
jgi:stage III sporulation protein SpoIIIAA